MAENIPQIYRIILPVKEPEKRLSFIRAFLPSKAEAAADNYFVNERCFVDEKTLFAGKR